MKKTLDYLHTMKNANEQIGQEPINIYEAIKELEELQNTINTAIEEIEYALENPDYAEFYLSNAKRFLMEI